MGYKWLNPMNWTYKNAPLFKDKKAWRNELMFGNEEGISAEETALKQKQAEAEKNRQELLEDQEKRKKMQVGMGDLFGGGILNKMKTIIDYNKLGGGSSTLGGA
jgi:hypothetical protein